MAQGPAGVEDDAARQEALEVAVRRLDHQAILGGQPPPRLDGRKRGPPVDHDLQPEVGQDAGAQLQPRIAAGAGPHLQRIGLLRVQGKS
ncbi:MAG: hypothetical protein ACRD2Z_01645, partial [Thermoanaerobaculia bacterium]